VQYISKDLPSPAELEALPTPVSIAIVGCGASSLIPFYIETTSCKFPVYSDPTRRLYSALKFTRHSQRGSEQSEYHNDSTFRSLWRALSQALPRIPRGELLKGGASDQVGGEILFHGGKAAWCHRMRHATDHSKIAKIRELLGLFLT
jgi:hypothetical protein